MERSLRVLLWSYNFAPEPSGIAPLATTAAHELAARGHEVTVVAAHPHYPEPRWGVRKRPYVERHGDVRVIRLPIWIGRKSAKERVIQDGSFLAAAALVAPLLPKPDVMLATSPSFPALSVPMGLRRLWRVPWVLWLQDILPDGAEATGMIDNERVLGALRRFERAAYASADRIIVISDSFGANIRAKGVPAGKITRIYNPATRPVNQLPRPAAGDRPRALCMGNIGETQGLDDVVRAFQDHPDVLSEHAMLVLAGTGVAAEKVRAAITDGHVEMTGLLMGDELTLQMQRAHVGLVTQRAGLSEFNVPSKLSNYLAAGLPVVASVAPDSEVSHIVKRSGAGWVVDPSDPGQLAATVVEACRDERALAARARAALDFARDELSAEGAAERIEGVLMDSVQS